MLANKKFFQRKILREANKIQKVKMIQEKKKKLGQKKTQK